MGKISLEGLRRLDPRSYYGMDLLEEDILEWFDACDAYWVHDGDPKKPHAELTSGKCSNGFFDCMRVLKYPNITEILAQRLVQVLKDWMRDIYVYREIPHIDWVIGSPYAAITFSYEVAKELHAIHGFCEKDPAAPKEKEFLWQRMAIPGGSKVLQIEELITTSETFRGVQRAIEEGNPEPVHFLPVVGALVHRPPKLPVDYSDRRVVALVEKEIWAVEPEECPLCKAGSVRYRPKTHWKELTGKG